MTKKEFESLKEYDLVYVINTMYDVYTINKGVVSDVHKDNDTADIVFPGGTFSIKRVNIFISKEAANIELRKLILIMKV